TCRRVSPKAARACRTRPPSRASVSSIRTSRGSGDVLNNQDELFNDIKQENEGNSGCPAPDVREVVLLRPWRGATGVGILPACHRGGGLAGSLCRRKSLLSWHLHRQEHPACGIISGGRASGGRFRRRRRLFGARAKAAMERGCGTTSRRCRRP